MEFTAAELWNLILEGARPAFPEQSFQTWLASSRAVSFSADGGLLVEAASPFHQEMIEDRFQPVLLEVAERILGRPLDLQLQAAEPERTQLPPVDLAAGVPFAGGAGPGRRPEARPEPEPAAAFGLNARYTFDRFVVGNNNQLAAAACRAVAEKPARMYNPLFLYGGVGLGKTHLMHAIGNAIRETHGHSKITYLSSEHFMNDLVMAIQEGKTADFRRRFRAVALLLVDDVHFLENKERTQEEFFHTFNALYDAQKQIILTSDRPPKEIPGLEERLVSRFEWGLVADIKPPDYETRVAILRKKASDDHLTLENPVIDFIARACTASVRELEGAVIKLLAYSSLTNQEVTVSLARTALSGMLREPGQPDPAAGLSPEHIKRMVAEEWDVKVEALASRRRTKDLTVPRQVSMYLLKDLLHLPLVQIGDLFGGRDHSTVIYSIQKVEDSCEQDLNFKHRVEELRRRLTRSP
jgi:chromosomal replication initiator protein